MLRSMVIKYKNGTNYNSPELMSSGWIQMTNKRDKSLPLITTTQVTGL